MPSPTATSPRHRNPSPTAVSSVSVLFGLDKDDGNNNDDKKEKEEDEQEEKAILEKAQDDEETKNLIGNANDPTKEKTGHNNHVETKKEEEEKVPALLLSVTYFVYNACVACVVPFITVYFHSLGLNSSAVGGLNSIRTLLAFVAAPIWGVLADNKQQSTFILMVSERQSFLFDVFFFPPAHPSALYALFYTNAVIFFFLSIFFSSSSISEHQLP